MAAADQIKKVFLAALDLTPTDRATFLDEACAGDASLRRAVEVLLHAHDRPDPLLDQSAAKHITVADGVALDFLEPSARPGSLGRLKHYEILEVVGRGGMGIVLRAFDEKLHRVVAIKVLDPGLAISTTSRQRFIREARAIAAVTHDHIVAIHAVEDSGPVPYLVMQFVDGCTLQQKLDRDGPLPLQEILRLGVQIAEGLAAAHRHGLIHRDIKPANILLENGIERVKITDFGLARAGDDSKITHSGVVAGTPAYMSPEQANGEKVDHRSDLFSFGSVLYALCTGQTAFGAGPTMAVLRRVCDEVPRPIPEISPEVPEWLVAAIAKLHAKRPSERYGSATEVASLFSRRLLELQTGVFLEATTTLMPPLRSRSRPAASRGILKWLIPVMGLVLVGVLVTTGNRLWPRPQPTTTHAEPVSVPVPMASPNDPLPSRFVNRLGMEFVRVPKGHSWLEGGGGRPGQREVEIPADFYLGTYEVTQEQWQQVMGSNPSSYSRSGGNSAAVKDLSDEDLKRFPVEMVSWDDAQRFVAKVNAATKEEGWTYRLPTVVEWEYACRGGPMSGPSASVFFFYLDPPANQIQPGQENFKHARGLGRPCPVGSYAPNLLGLHDMYANIAEWCADAGRSQELRVGRMDRSGAYWLKADQLNAGLVLPPEGAFHDVGLRLARVPIVQPQTRRNDFEAWRTEVAALPAEQQVTAVTDLLRARNPTFYDKVTARITGGVVTELTFLTDNVSDLEPVRALTGLRVLRCGGSRDIRGQLPDLTPLRGLPLTHLDCRNSMVADLAPLAGMPLQTLICQFTLLTDLTPIKDLKLTVLDCSHTLVSDLEPLRGLPLRELTCDFHPERDLPLLRSLTSLQTLNRQRAAAVLDALGTKKGEEKP